MASDSNTDWAAQVASSIEHLQTVIPDDSSPVWMIRHGKDGLVDLHGTQAAWARLGLRLLRNAVENDGDYASGCIDLHGVLDGMGGAGVSETWFDDDAVEAASDSRSIRGQVIGWLVAGSLALFLISSFMVGAYTILHWLIP